MTPHENPLRRVLLLRHGLTDWNVERRWQGRADVPLNADGLAQAEAVAELLVRDTSISVLAHSTSKRAAQTAAVVKGAFDLAGRPPVVVAREDLVEIDVGEWSGLLQSEVLEREPGIADRIGRDANLRYGVTGESLHEVGARGACAVGEVASLSERGQSTLVVTHGAVILAVVAQLLGRSVDEVGRLFGSTRNCHWVEITQCDGGWRIERWNAGL